MALLCGARQPRDTKFYRPIHPNMVPIEADICLGRRRQKGAPSSNRFMVFIIPPTLVTTW